MTTNPRTLSPLRISRSELVPASTATPEGRSSTMPNGTAIAAQAFAWLNRQLSWQAILEDLESVSQRDEYRAELTSESVETRRGVDQRVGRDPGSTEQPEVAHRG